MTDDKPFPGIVSTSDDVRYTLRTDPVLTDPMMQFFAYSHLPDHLQQVSAEFGRLALFIVDNLPRNPERTVALRKLLEAKDCAVRARLWKDDNG